MRLFDRGAVQEVVVGVGLIGGAVCEALAHNPGLTRTHKLQTPWGNPSELSPVLASARAWLDAGDAQARVRVFWCAGRGGFASSPADLKRELDSFEQVLRWAEALAEGRDVEFHLTSSAGGLHAGQRRVESAQAAEGSRPYGRLKLDQGQLLAQAKGLKQYVYRPSSVYGVPRGKARLGMIPTLIRNAMYRRPSTISAHPSTLRDYVSADDVGAYLSADGRAPGLRYLVMGQPMSIFSLVAVVERAMQRQVAVVFTTTKLNHEHISFAPAMKPADWSPGPLESKVSLLLAAILR
jgi:UDP-glucose 4-epimerase